MKTLGKMFVIFAATCGCLWAVYHFHPAIASTAFEVRGYPVAWTLLCGAVLAYTFHRFTSHK